MASTFTGQQHGSSSRNQPSNNLEAGYWVSYNKHIGPKVSGNGRTFMISVSLDSGAWESCRGVRIVVARREDDDLADISISNCMHPKAYPEGSNLPPLSQRDVLAQRRRARAIFSDEYSGLESTSNSSGDIFTIAYELVKVNVYWIELIPLTSTKNLSGLITTYDQTFPLSASSHSILTTLESTIAIRRDPSLYPRRRCSCSKRTRPDFPTLVHTVRISPHNTSGRRVCPLLPPEVIRQVALFVIQPTHDGWRRDLSSLGFISRGWTRVLDLFFKTYWGNRPMRDKPSAVAVANSLSYRTERAAAIRQLFLCNFNEADKLDSMDQAEKSVVLAALVKILSLAKQIKRLEIIPMDYSEKDRYLSALLSQRDVEYCTVLADFSCNRYGGTVSGDGYPRVGVDVMQALTARWPKLSMLDYTGPDESLTIPPIEAPPTTEAASCNVKYLTLRRVHLNARQFVGFLDAPYPRLNTICLIKVSGLTNHDLFDGLYKVASSVTNISIAECTFPRTLPDEEYALDAIMPYLTSLQSISVTGDCVDWLSVARKTPNEHITFGPSISIGRAPLFKLDRLPEALETSHWSTVSITSEMPMGPEALEKARAVAAEKGMNFWYWHEKPPSPPIFQTIVAHTPGATYPAPMPASSAPHLPVVGSS